MKTTAHTSNTYRLCRKSLQRLLFLIVVGILPFSASANQLLKVTKVDLGEKIQLYFTFDTMPKFTETTNNRRIDLVFSDTTAAPDLQYFDTNTDIVKILPRVVHQGKGLALSLFFRYKPQQSSLKASEDNRVVFEVLVGNEYSGSYRDLVTRLKGVTLLDQSTIDYTNPTVASPYAGDWKSFFMKYETPVTPVADVRYTLPPFPLISLLPPGMEENVKVLNIQITQAAESKNWEQASAQIIELLKTEKDEENQKLLALTLGEALTRSGDFDGAFKQLYLLKENYPEELLSIYADFLMVLLRTAFQGAFLGAAEYEQLAPKIKNDLPIAAYLNIARIETALASDDLQTMNKLLLRDNIAYPANIQKVLQIRQADYWSKLDQPVKAYAAYHLQGGGSVQLSDQPSSLCRYCNTLYYLQNYREAADCYQQLTPEVTNKDQQGMVSYRRSMARLRFTPASSLISEFSQIESTFDESEAGLRARMKRTDLQFLQSRDQSVEALKSYEWIFEHSTNRAVSEEALFKRALVNAITGNNGQAIELAQQLLREFQTGDVRISAQALLIELLPPEIKKLVDEQRYVEALVAAKKNRTLFENNWVDSRFLVDIAEADSRLGLFREAKDLYLYVIEVCPIDKREQYFFPMIQATYENGNYNEVDDYCAQYNYNYPDGEDHQRVLLIRLKSLVAQERLDDAARLLPDPLPDEKEYRSLAARLFFRRNNYQQCIAILELDENSDTTPLDELEIFMLAESRFKTGDIKRAEQGFETVAKRAENSHYANALYRLAELARGRGEEENALNFFRKIVETSDDELWKGFAERELQVAKTERKF